MIEIADLAVEYVAIGVGASHGSHHIDVACTLQGDNRVFLGIRVHITDNQKIGIAAIGWITSQPVSKCLGSKCTCAVTVALTFRGVIITGTTARAFTFEVVDDQREAPASGVFLKRLGQS